MALLNPPEQAGSSVRRSLELLGLSFRAMGFSAAGPLLVIGIIYLAFLVAEATEPMSGRGLFWAAGWITAPIVGTWWPLQYMRGQWNPAAESLRVRGAAGAVAMCARFGVALALSLNLMALLLSAIFPSHAGTLLGGAVVFSIHATLYMAGFAVVIGLGASDVVALALSLGIGWYAFASTQMSGMWMPSLLCPEIVDSWGEGLRTSGNVLVLATFAVATGWAAERFMRT